jgi:uncharacterized protein (DUF2141 family)
MKLKRIFVTFFLLISTAYSIENDTLSLTIKVDKLQNSKGVVQFVLYDKEQSIPDMNFEKYCQKGTAVITEKSASYTFESLPRGRYAVNILHDENNNQKIDKRFILPKEGFGFSNYNSLGFFNRPNFIKASFELKTDSTIYVKINYL